jgi:biopolymer transport protein ExbD
MSHGGGGDEIAEPDLTPLLDLVLQLLMFFIINVNFVSEQVSADIKLPSSESARPIDKADPGAIFLGQKVKTPEYLAKLTEKERERFRNFDSIVLIPTQPPMSPPEARAWLKDKHEFLVKLKGEGKVDTIIYFRPDADLEYGEMTKLMTSCKVAGFTRIKVRAQMKRAGS